MTMLKVRIIPCLDVKDGRVVKGVQFVDLKDAGDPVEHARAYDAIALQDALIADEPAAFAESVIRLYSDSSLWERLSINGAEAARRLFSIEVSEAAYTSIFRQLGLPVTPSQKLP